MLSVLDNDLTVHQNVIDPYGRKQRLFVGCAVLDLVVIKNDDIGPVAFFYHSACREPHTGRRPRGHLSYGFFERQDLLLANVTCDQACVISVSSRMCKADRIDLADLFRSARVTADACPWKLESGDDVLLAHHMVDGVHAALALHYEVVGRVRRVLVPFFRYLGEILAFETGILFVLSVDQDNVVPAAGRLDDVPPARRAGLKFILKPYPNGR